MVCWDSLRKGQVNTDTSVLTLPLNGSSINTKYLFRCYCATSVPNDLLIPRSPSLGVSKYTRNRERLAGTDAVVPARTLCNTRARSAASRGQNSAPLSWSLPPLPPGLSLAGYSQQSRHFLFSAIRYLRTWESAGMANLETFNWDAANLILSLADLKGKKKIFKKKIRLQSIF